MISPTWLALLSPRFRGIALEMDRAPVSRREGILKRWLATQPDGDEIMAAVMAADPDGPCPLPGDIRKN